MQTFTKIAALAVFLGLTTALPSPSASSTLERRNYVPGNCGLHVTQHQKNEDGTGANYVYDVRIYDAIQAQIGGNNDVSIADYAAAPFDSNLPYTVVVTSGAIDDDPIRFMYASETWSTRDGQCSVGGYQNGLRQVDCGFTCN